MAFGKHKQEPHENLERWLVSYADFITLMFAFFTVLYALSQTDKARYEQAVESIRKAILSGGGVFPLKGTPFTPFDKKPDQGSLVPPSPFSEGPYSITQDQAERMSQNLHRLFERNTGLSLSRNDIEIVPARDGFRIRLAEQVLFRDGSDRIRKEHVPFLYDMGKKLSHLGMQIQVEGHTDKAGGSQSNWQLSLARSSNIVKFLVDGAGFSPDKLAVAGMGDTRPIADNATAEGRARNRRVEIAVISPTRDLTQLPW